MDKIAKIPDVCGRCLLPDNSFVSDTPYENLATTMYFPCRYKKYGCEHQEKSEEVKTHEENCEFKEYRCPVVTDGSCQWLGPVKQILQHVENNHNDKVLPHPCEIPYMLPIKNQTNVYITSKGGFLFLIHSQASVVSRRLHHCVKILASSEYAKLFEFELTIQTNSTKIINKKDVLSFHSSETEENTLVTSISILQELFNNLKDLKIILSIHSTSDINKCSSCEVLINKFVYQSNDAYKCEKCLPQLKNCSKCTFQDIETKLNKHEQYFCKFVTSCKNCERPDGSYSSHSRGRKTVLDHIKYYHSQCYHTSGIFDTSMPDLSPHHLSVLGTGRTTSLKKLIVITNSTVGIIFCEIYKHKENSYSNTATYFNIYASLPSKDLNNYNCQLEILHPETKLTVKKILNRENGLDADWSLKLQNFNITGEVQIKITFSNRNPHSL